MRYNRFRIVCGIAMAALFIFIYFFGSDGAAKQAFSDEAEWQGALLYGDHYVFRFIVGILSVSLGAFVGGVIARRKGGVVGILATVPTFIIFSTMLYLLYGILQDSTTATEYAVFSWGNKIMLALLLLSMLPISYFAGEAGAEIGSGYAPFFDKQRFCWLGVKWYFYILLFVTSGIWYIFFMWGLGSFLRFFSSIGDAWKIGIGTTIGTIFVVGLLIPIFWEGAVVTVLSFLGGYMSLYNVTVNGSGIKKFGKSLLCTIVIPLAISFVIYGTLYFTNKGWSLMMLLFFQGVVCIVLYSLAVYPLHCISTVSDEIDKVT